MHCPECKTDDVYRVRVAWESGASTGESHAVGSGRTYISSSGIAWGEEGLARDYSHSSGNFSYAESSTMASSTLRANRLAPPPEPVAPARPLKPKSVGCLVVPFGSIAGFIIGVIGTMITGPDSATWWNTGIVATPFVLLLLLFLNRRRLLRIGEAQYEAALAAYTAELPAHAKLMLLWERSWCCGRCGHVADEDAFEGAA